MKQHTHHVVLTTYGEPATASFGEQLTYSWRILLGLTRTVAPIPLPLIPLIALYRARFRHRLWTREQYQSPLESISQQQAGQLQKVLQERDPSVEWRVHVAYEFRRPLVRETLARIPADEPVTVVPMYAADSDFTHALSRTVVTDVAHSRSFQGQIGVLPAFPADDLGAISASHVLESLPNHETWSGDDVALVLAAHGTLIAPSRPIETGLEATEQLCDAVRHRLSDKFGLIVNGWLNHTRGGKWTEPSIDEALRQVVASGIKRVVYFPYGFLADNAESQLEGRLALRNQPALQSLHLPCLNESPALLNALARAVVSHGAHGGDGGTEPNSGMTTEGTEEIMERTDVLTGRTI